MAASGRRAGLRLAKAYTALAAEQRFDAWLDQVPGPMEETDWNDSLLGVAVSADRSRLTWSATNRLYAFLDPFFGFLTSIGAPPTTIDSIRAAQDRLDPSSFGAWIEGTAETINLGWYFSGLYWLDDAAPLLADHDLAARLLAWAEEADVDRLRRFGRSLDEDDPWTDLRLPLPGEDAVEQWEIGLAAFEALNVEPPSPEIDAILQTMPWPESGSIELSVWLLEDGLAKLGLLIPAPDTTTVLLLSELAGVTDHADLATFEGLLGVEEREAVEVQQFASGFDVEIHSTLP